MEGKEESGEECRESVGMRRVRGCCFTRRRGE
jgi:hypothetical protein